MDPGLAPSRGLELLWGREPAEAVEQPLDEVDLSLCERRVEPDAARGDAVPARRLDHVAARGAREVRVVEDHALRAGGERVVESGGHLPQRSAPLVAVEKEVAVGDVVLGDPRLAGAG